MQTDTTPGSKAHFFLACAEVTFADTQGQTGITRLNSMIKSETGTVGVRLLGRAQQAIQMQLMKSLEDPTLIILNVVFLAISDLGEMTDEEFHAQDGEKAAND